MAMSAYSEEPKSRTVVTPASSVLRFSGQAWYGGIAPQIDDIGIRRRPPIGLDGANPAALHNHRDVGPDLAPAIYQFSESKVLCRRNRGASDGDQGHPKEGIAHGLSIVAKRWTLRNL
jgi:hypothetical protein